MSGGRRQQAEIRNGSTLESLDMKKLREYKQRRDRSKATDTITIGPFTLQTTLEGSSGNQGIMFDVSSPPGGQIVKIISMDIHVDVVDPSCWVEIYGRRGTHVGFESTSSAWTPIVNTTIQCKGFGVESHVPQTAFLQAPQLAGNESFAFYVNLPQSELRYDPGTPLGGIAASNQYLAILSGTGLGGQFNQTYPGRVWNGAITYNVTKPKSQGLPDPPAISSTSKMCASNLTTSYTDNIGSYGQMFNIQTFNNMIEVTGVDFYTDLLSPVTYQLYSRNGTFVDGGTLDQWVFLQWGTINGYGTGKGTPIRGFAPFVVYPNAIQGFYVTLTEANLRYRLLEHSGPTDLKVGDMYIHNDDVAIQLGASVGTYPLGNTFFGPRLFSGAIVYNLYGGCPTTAPTLAPSPFATNTPSSIITLAPTPSGSFVGACTTESSLVTKLDGTTGAYGVMFTVVAKNESLSITSLELLIGTTSNVDVRVYSKPGDYKGFEDTPSAWQQVANTKVQASGSTFGTIIPSQNFETVTIYPGRLHAFYVTISTPDLLYSLSTNVVGTEVATNDYLSINAGAGLIDKTFSPKLLEPRFFNGALVFIHSTSCYTQTVVSFGYLVQYTPSLTSAKVYEMVSRTVGATVQSLVNTAPDLELFKTSYDLAYNSTHSFSSSRAGGNGLCGNLIAGWNCIPLGVNVTLSHRITLDEGQLKVDLLNYASNITSALNSDATKMQVAYAGSVATGASVRITLLGNLDATMAADEQDYFKTVTMDYLQKKLAGQANVFGVKIVDQKLNKGKGGRHGRFLQRSSSSLDITTTITGEYTPPPDLQLGASSSDAINANNGNSFTQDIQDSARQKPEWLQNKAYFEKVTGATSQDLSFSPTRAPTPQSGGGISSGGLIGIIVIFAILFLAIVYYFCFCRNVNKDAEIDNDGMPVHINSSILKYDEKIMEADCYIADSQIYDSKNHKKPGYSKYDLADPRQDNYRGPSKGGDLYGGSPVNYNTINIHNDSYAFT